MTKVTKLHSEDIRAMRSAGKSTQEINRYLKSVGVNTTLSTIRRHYRERIIHKRNPRKMKQDIVAAIDQMMSQNQKTTVSSVKKHIWRDNGVSVSERSIRRIKQKLGWRYKKNLLRPTIADTDKEARLQLAQKWIDEKEMFHDVIFSDEITLTLDHFSSVCKTERREFEPKRKRCVKVHVWAAISRLGPGPIVIFDRILDRTFFEDTIIRETAAPYIRENFGVHHRFIQDNDPKHTAAGKVIAAEDINWVKTPAESPDLNPIEMVWHELKEYLRIEAQPTIKTELTAAIHKFWFEELTEAKCNKYINRLLEVLPAVVKNQGGYTGM
ncbi:uncharacterized protein LOC326903 [Danio rerio]|uniref:Si:dkey-77f5.3 n=1 Tax=Danio rerio TaxID=7955 RepID=E7F6I3_DANRE|nr:uncharacterized protein LOC326903 [Danio rerio]|eukprot:NP_001315129.1 uncharacterized protein LOC326903 [Danio rerio]